MCNFQVWELKQEYKEYLECIRIRDRGSGQGLAIGSASKRQYSMAFVMFTIMFSQLNFQLCATALCVTVCIYRAS